MQGGYSSVSVDSNMVVVMQQKVVASALADDFEVVHS